MVCRIPGISRILMTCPVLSADQAAIRIPVVGDLIIREDNEGSQLVGSIPCIGRWSGGADLGKEAVCGIIAIGSETLPVVFGGQAVIGIVGVGETTEYGVLRKGIAHCIIVIEGVLNLGAGSRGMPDLEDTLNGVIGKCGVCSVWVVLARYLTTPIVRPVGCPANDARRWIAWVGQGYHVVPGVVTIGENTPGSL